MGWRRAPAGPRRRCPERCPAEYRRYRTGTPGTRESRRLGTLVETGDAASGVGPDHLLYASAGSLFGRLRRQRLAIDQLGDFIAVQDFADQQHFGDGYQRFGVLVDDGLGRVVTTLHQFLHLLIDADGGVFGVVPVLRDFAAQEDLLFLLAVAHGPEFAHAPFADHLAGQIGGALDIVAGAGSHVVHELLFGDAARHEDGELGEQVVLVVGVLVVEGQLHGDAERHTARDDGDLVQRVGAGQAGGDQVVPDFVVRRVALFGLAHDHALALRAHQDFVLGELEIEHHEI